MTHLTSRSAFEHPCRRSLADQTRSRSMGHLRPLQFAAFRSGVRLRGTWCASAGRRSRASAPPDGVTVKFAVDAVIPFSLGCAVNVITCKMVAIPTIEDEDASGAASPGDRRARPSRSAPRTFRREVGGQSAHQGRSSVRLGARRAPVCGCGRHKASAFRLSGLCPAFPLGLVLCGAPRCTQEFPERRLTDPHNPE
jgi:hypothetical protein